MSEQYRFQNGSLYEYDVRNNSYIHCYRSADASTKAKAILKYEEGCQDEEYKDLNGHWNTWND